MYKLRNAIILAAATLCVASPAIANGYNHSTSHGFGAVSAKALGKSYARYKGSYGSISQHSQANTKSSIEYGQILNGNANAKNNNKVHIGSCKSKCSKKNGIVIKEKTEARTKIYAKGKKILMKARAKNYLSVEVKGKLWYENEQTAIAVGRHTPLGSKVGSWARNNGTLSAKGFVRYSNGNVATTSVTLK